MDFHVITPAESELVMQTADGRVVQVLPAPVSSLPGGTAPISPALHEMLHASDKC